LFSVQNLEQLQFLSNLYSWKWMDNRGVGLTGTNWFWRATWITHNVKYNKEGRKLWIIKVHIKNNKITWKWTSKVDVSRLNPLGLLKLHATTKGAIFHSILEQELEKYEI